MRIFLILAFITLFSGACGKEYKYKKFTDKNKKITINYPATWSYLDSFTSIPAEVPILVSFRPPDSPKETKSEDYAESVTLIFSDGDNNYNDIKKALKENVKAFTLIGEEKITINGQECSRLIYTGVQGGDIFRSVDQIFYLVEDGIYVITYLSVPKMYEKFKKEFEKIAGSLTVLK